MSNTISGLPIFSPSQSPVAGSSPNREKTGGFGAALKDAITQVEQLHTDAQGQMTQLMNGGTEDVHNVMIAIEKADVSFQLMMQVRNKIVNAYQEVSRMQF